MLYRRIQKEHARLEEQIQELQRKLEKLPEGKLICCKDGKGYRWYQSDGHKKVYLYKKQRTLAEKLALRKYYQALLVRCDTKNARWSFIWTITVICLKKQENC